MCGAVAAVAALAVLLSACSANEPGTEATTPAEPPASSPVGPSPSAEPGTSGYDVVTIEETVPDEWVREQGPRPDVSAGLVERMSDLGVSVWQYQRAQKPEDNVWVSPVSAYQALSMVAPGVGPEASDELFQAMGLEPWEIADNTRDLADWIVASERSDYRMALYNAAFVARTYGGFAPEYLEAIEPIRDELGGFDPLDPQGTADLINSRVDEHTRGMIDEILSSGDITADLVSILLNATYFKGTWVDPFDPALNQEGEFTLLDGSLVPTEMMQGFGYLAVATGDGFRAAVLPYEGGAQAVIVLPDEGRFDEVVAGLTASTLATLSTTPADEQFYAFRLPKFTTDSGMQELVPALRSLGVQQVFEGTPNWPMFGNSDDHSIAFVKHRVVVAVNELGTEAAAATAVGGIGGGPEYTFDVDRPFAMAILDADDAVLFVGQVTDPR
jgi:serine protease inhibitor